MKKRIVIAGATGFIGRWIIKNFKNEYDIVALSRKEVSNNQDKNIIWKILNTLPVEEKNQSQKQKKLEKKC